MKKLILCALFGALALLLVQRPQPVDAMDSGMMGNGNYGSYDMGPGMMHDSGSRNYGRGPGMMDQGYENEPHYYHNQKSLDKKDAARILKEYLNSHHNPELKVGAIKDQGSSFEADLLTQDNSLVDRLIVDKDTGRLHSAH